MRYLYLVLLLVLGLFTFIVRPAACADTPKPRTMMPAAVQPPLTKADLVGLWSGNVRVPGHTEIWQLLPKLIYYRKNGTSATVYLRNTVLFQKDGTFIVTTEGDTSTSSPLQYQGHYTVGSDGGKTVLTMMFEKVVWGTTPHIPETLNSIFRYTLSRWSDELQLNAPEQAGFGTLLGPMARDWQPRKGSPFYQGSSGPMQIEMDGGLTQTYHYIENGITHYADVYGSWRQVRPNGSHGDSLIRLEGVRDGAEFKTVTVPLQAIPGLSAEIKQLQASTTVILYSYSLELIQVADTKPTQYVWAIHLDSSAGWQPEPAPVPPPTLYPSLTSPDLRQLIGHLPRKTRLIYAPQWRGFGRTPAVIKPDDPEYGLKEFADFCKSKGVRFDLNYNRF